MVKVGQKAPDFELPSSTGRKIRLSSYRGKKNVLIAFYCYAFSPTCSIEFIDFRMSYDKFVRRNTEILGVSMDGLFATKAFKTVIGVPFPMLSDPDGKVERAYGVYDAEKNRASRSYFLVDKKGVVRFKYMSGSTWIRLTDEELLLQIDKLENTKQNVMVA